MTIVTLYMGHALENGDLMYLPDALYQKRCLDPLTLSQTIPGFYLSAVQVF